MSENPANSNAKKPPREPAATPSSLVEWFNRQLTRGNVERFELQQLSASSDPKIVEDWDANEGGGAPEQLADLVWARAIDDSKDSIETSAAVHYGVLSFVAPGTGSGSLKKFVVPARARVDASPLERPNAEGVLAGSMRHLNKSTEASHLFVQEMAKQSGDSFERTQLAWKTIVESHVRTIETLERNFDTQLKWKDTELVRLRDRNKELEDRALAERKLGEELESEKFERDLRMLKAAHGEERKNQVANHVIANVLPIVTRRFGGMLNGLGAGPAPAPSTSPESPPAAPMYFTPREAEMIRRFLACCGLAELNAIQTALASLEGSTALPAFEQLLTVLWEEDEKRNQAEAAAANGAVNGTNGAAAHGDPS